MFTMRMLLSFLLFLALTSLGAAQPAQPPAGETGGAPQAHEALVGTVTREQIESTQPDWKQAEDAAAPDLGAARSLATVRPGAEVTVFLGTWCGDSRREVPRLWRALDAATAAGGSPPFQVHYIGVDRQKKEPAAPIANYEIEFVPTIIVSRQGREVGRIVEQSPNGVERDLLALLSGKARGVLSATQAGETAPPPSR
ncbi:MAG TPA: thioredoxin family protein [Thermoanaerobaculia bacterium]|nr:thioredoxin family protein [Thermoanaerobaculia bacterium]